MRSGAVVNSALRSLARDSEENIIIYIQSPGGSVSAGFSIYDTSKAIRCDIVTVACGMAASMGAFLLTAAGTKGKRWCQPNAEVLIHQPLGGINGQATDIRIHAEHMLKTRVRLNRIISESTGQTPQKIELVQSVITLCVQKMLSNMGLWIISEILFPSGKRR